MKNKKADSQCSDAFQEDEEEKALQKYRKEANQIIGKINAETISGRRVLAKNYKLIQKMLEGLNNDRFNLSEEPEQINEIVKCSFFYRPYDLNNSEFKFLSSFCKEAVNGNRRVKPPSVQIEDETININQKNVRLNSNKQEFTIKIEAEPSAGILYTNVPETHPLLVDPVKLKSPYFLKYAEKQVLDILYPPCQISIVAVGASRLESKVINLKVTAKILEGQYREMNMGYAVRPAENFPFEESAFGSESASFCSVQDYMHEESGND